VRYRNGKRKCFALNTFDRDIAKKTLAEIVAGFDVPPEKRAMDRFIRAGERDDEYVDAAGLSPVEQREFAMIAARLGWHLFAVRNES